jgi:hypothetical protein
MGEFTFKKIIYKIDMFPNKRPRIDAGPVGTPFDY